MIKINKTSLITWPLAFAIAGVFITGKKLTETDADKKAQQAAFASKMDKILVGLDKTGKLAKGEAAISLMGSFFDFCKANVVAEDSGATLSDEDKKNYCGCATRGMQELYYGNLSDTELLRRAKLPPPGDLGPPDVRQQVSAACTASLDAYK